MKDAEAHLCCSRLAPFLMALLVIGLPLAALAAGGQDIARRQVKAVLLPVAPTIDGDLHDQAWKQAALLTGFTDAYDQSPETEPTTAWIGYDSQCIYVAFRCRESDPNNIIAQQTRLEGSLDQDDHVTFRLNPFGTRRGEDESEFSVNPLGTQETDIAGGRAGKQEWRGAWRAAAQRTEEGWAVEMAIPWSILTHPIGREVDMDINFSRYIARDRRLFYWSNVGTNGRRELVGRWLGVHPPSAPRRNPLSLLGYNFSGTNGDRRTILRSGVDARYELTPQMTLVGSINPDFANIEGDVQDIDFSYSEKLAAERRPFFLEGGDYFRFGGGGGGYGPAIFTPQRIGPFDAGIKLYGKARPTSSVGLLGTFSGQRQDFVLRWREMPSPSASLTFGYVKRADEEVANDVWQTQGWVRQGDWNLSASYARSTDRVSEGERWDSSIGYFGARWGGSLRYSQTSPGFIAHNGYIPFTDTREVGGFLYYGGQWKRGPIRDFNLSLNAYETTHYSNAFFQRGCGTSLRVRTASDLGARINLWSGGFEEYRDRITSLSLEYPASDPFHHVGLSYSFGRRSGHPYRFFAPYFAYRFGDRLSIRLSVEAMRHQESSEQEILTVNYDLNREHSLGGRMVSRNGQTNWYLSFRRSGYGGLEYYLIVGDPNAQRFTERVVLKVVAPLYSR